jgi:His/Glu/Gln/Arg/opine family amino acid ABC transporter permease subunit
MPDVILHNLPFLLDCLGVTVELALVSAAGGTVLGLTAALVRYLRVPILAAVVRVYIEFVRGTPLLVILFISYFAIPALPGYRATAFGASCLGFIFFIGAYIAEDIRAGLASVPEDTINAGLASGLRRSQVLRLIVLPQGLRRVIPVLTGQYVRLFKFTSVASVIGVRELTGGAMLINARTFAPIAILAAIAMTYLVICTAISLGGRLLYRSLAVQS